jgi:hypothetical protein
LTFLTVQCGNVLCVLAGVSGPSVVDAEWLLMFVDLSALILIWQSRLGLGMKIVVRMIRRCFGVVVVLIN